MIDLIKRAFGIKPPVDFTKLVNQGAIILDVRTLSEYSSGHIKKSLHIPLNEIATNLHAKQQSSRYIKSKRAHNCL
jgi:rhodanese-related sulfurtransferase